MLPLPPPYKRMVGPGGVEPPRTCARGRWATDYPTTRRSEIGVSDRSRTGWNGWHRPAARRLPSPTIDLVAGEGIEPPCAVCRTAVLPLNEPAVGRGGGNRTRISRFMGPPRSPSLPSAAVDNSFSGGPGGNRTLIPWVQARDPPVERRAHPGEDNGTRTRTPALTTRRLSLRLCPPQDGPSGGIRTHMTRLLRPMRSVGLGPTA